MFGDKKTKIAKAVEKKKVDTLLGLIEDKDHSIAIAAIEGVGKVGSDDGFNALIPLLHHADGDVRIAAAKALAEIGNGHAHAHIAHQISLEQDETVKKALNEAMSKLRTDE